MSGRDRERIEEDLAGVEQPARPRNLSSTYLHQAAEAFHAAGDPGHLYGQWIGQMPSAPMGRNLMRRWAGDARDRRSLECVVFAAFAAEAFVNEFLQAVDGAVAQRVDSERWSLRRKYIDATAEAYGETLFREGDEAMPKLVELFERRNQLAHPQPGLGPPALLDNGDEDLGALFEMPEMAEYVVMVAGAADLMVWRAYGYGHVDAPARLLWGPVGGARLRGKERRVAISGRSTRTALVGSDQRNHRHAQHHRRPAQYRAPGRLRSILEFAPREAGAWCSRGGGASAAQE